MGDDRTGIQVEGLALILETCETKKQVQILSLGSVGKVRVGRKAADKR